MNKNYCGANIKDFKVGDKVICIDNKGVNNLISVKYKKNTVYTIEKIDGPFIFAKEVNFGAYSERFKKLYTQLELF